MRADARALLGRYKARLGASDREAMQVFFGIARAQLAKVGPSQRPPVHAYIRGNRLESCADGRLG